MPIWLGSSSAAPVIDKSRTVQSMVPPAEINRCRFQDTVARCDSSFDHSIEIRQKPKELIKLSVVLRSSRNKIRIVGRFEGGPEVNRLIDGSLGVWQDSLGFHPAASKRNMALSASDTAGDRSPCRERSSPVGWSQRLRRLKLSWSLT
jgi:hypothetical protein